MEIENKRENIYNEVNASLKKMLIWFSEFEDKFFFDFDSQFNEILEKHNINMSYGILKHVYSLVDVLYDSLSHNNLMITDIYSTDDGLRDLKYIINMIDLGKIHELENDFKLRSRLLKVYD
jgi:hypothetical protein